MVKPRSRQFLGFIARKRVPHYRNPSQKGKGKFHGDIGGRYIRDLK
jgi:hypothetical protein